MSPSRRLALSAGAFLAAAIAAGFSAPVIGRASRVAANGLPAVHVTAGLGGFLLVLARGGVVNSATCPAAGCGSGRPPPGRAPRPTTGPPSEACPPQTATGAAGAGLERLWIRDRSGIAGAGPAIAGPTSRNAIVPRPNRLRMTKAGFARPSAAREAVAASAAEG